MGKNNEFPIFNKDINIKETVPLSCIEEHANQLYENHGVSIEKMIDRGGLSWSETLAVLEGRQYRGMDESVAKETVLSLISK